MPNAQDRFESLRDYVSHVHGIRVTSKNENRGFWELLNFLWKLLTFGSGKNLLKSYTTTIGKTIYFPLDWTPENTDSGDYITLCHELTHVKQYTILGCGYAPLGFVIFLILYLFVPLPLGLAWFRYAFERQAYLESYKAARRLDLQPKINYYVTLLTGKTYLWAWLFKCLVRRWFTRRISP